MRKLKSVFFMCFIVFLFAVMPQTAKADELTEIDTRSTVIIKANVPDGFDENIAFVLEQETTQVRFAFALTADNDYTGKYKRSQWQDLSGKCRIRKQQRV